MTAPVYARPAVVGGARLSYEYLDAVGTRLVEQWVRPPLHMTKAYHDQDWAISQLMSPTAGLLSGDLLKVDVSVGEGARAAVISPAACRVHTMDSGCARIKQRFKIAAGGVLDVWPAPLILQKEAALFQETRVDMAADATLLLCEIVMPGRAAYGESFQFKSWASSLRIYREAKLLSYENFLCEPIKGDALDWQEAYPNANYASVYFLTPDTAPPLVQKLHDIDIEGASVGASLLRSGGGLGVKILAADGIQLRRAVLLARSILIE
ncbi:MAG: urease accessory protein UreD, partial [Verrucomicrobiota bacterium]